METEITEQWLDDRFIKNSIPFVPIWNIELGRGRSLNVSPYKGNQMVWISSHARDDKNRITDICVLFNSDYDGLLFAERVEKIYNAITNTYLTIVGADQL